MTIKPLTIDNLGIDPSVRYARDRESTDVKLLEDSKLISKKIEISVTKPYTPSEFDKLFSSDRSAQWALFTAPAEFEAHNRALFSFQLIPSLGTYEKQEADSDKLSALEEALHKPRKRKNAKQGDKEEKEEEEERKTLLALLKCIDKLDRTLIFINARRNQYQRG